MSHCNLGLSCEPVKEEDSTQYLPSCVPGKVGYCFKYKLAVTDKIMELANRIEAFHEHKIRQIDENRKISKRVDEIQQSREAHSRNHKDIFDRLEKLEKMNQECIDANPLKAISETFNEIDEQITYLMQKSHLNNEKRPFKCPVCLGSIKILIDPYASMSDIQAMFGNRDANGMYYKDCNSCEGKGIVWG